MRLRTPKRCPSGTSPRRTDRLTSETLDIGNNGSTDQTTTYTWTTGKTGYASKTVAQSGTNTFKQTYTYDLQGNTASVVTETYTAGAATNRTKVEYEYDSHGLRVSAKETVDSNPTTTTFEAASVFTKTEYLLDQANPTGYSQTIVETSKNSSGQRTKRIAYTFGSDEISQTVTTFNPTTQAVLTTEVHTFGHDGHGSVRVLFDAGSKLAQAYTYAAYGELLAIHNGLGASLGNAASAALTSMLYNGESFDSRIGQLYLRARWYDGHRFTTIDPYAGDASNPFSFNKYSFATGGDPILYVDPSGMFEGLGGFMSSIGMRVGLNGSGSAGVTAAGVWANNAMRIYDAATTAVAVFQGYMSGGALGAVAAIVGVGPDEIKDIKSALGDQGVTSSNVFAKLTSTAAGALPVIQFGVNVPKNGKLGRVFNQVAKMLGRSDKLQEFIGEMGAGLLMHTLGFGNAKLPAFPSVHGPDFVMRQGSAPVWAMVEAKGGRGKLSTGASYGDQMQWRWIRHWYHWLAKSNQVYGAHGSAYDGKDLWDHWGQGDNERSSSNAKPIIAAVANLDLNRAKDNPKVGIQAWTNRERDWKPWTRF